jgi:hypothetical protein
MGRRWSALAVGAILVAVAVAAAVPALGAASGDRLTDTWAKLNVCTPTEVGARAQLPGDGSSDRMAVRFTAQWLSPDGWVPVAGQATSPWIDAGSAAFTWQQAGWNFAMVSPESGEAYQMRAVADMRLGSSETATLTTPSCTLGG